MPQEFGRNSAPASCKISSIPSSKACFSSFRLAGATLREIPEAIFRPFKTDAAAAKSTYLAPVQAPM